MLIRPIKRFMYLFSGAHIGHSLSVSAYPSKHLKAETLDPKYSQTSCKGTPLGPSIAVRLQEVEKYKHHRG